MRTSANLQQQPQAPPSRPPLTYSKQERNELELKSDHRSDDEYIWQNFLATNRVIHLLRPDYFMIYKFSKSTILFQRNINLNIGQEEVTTEKIMHYMSPDDSKNISLIDKAMSHMSNEQKLQPLDYIYKVCGNMQSPNPDLKRIMRTSFLIHSNISGIPELGFFCFHDVSSMISSIKPNNYEITFDPQQAHLASELNLKLKNIRPSKMKITSRERDIILCLHNGMSSKAMASHLFISKATVDTHRQNMLRKWELPNTAALIKKAIEEGWV